MKNMKIQLAPLALLTASTAISGTWNGALATLSDAQVACTNTESRECLPYLAQAVAVAYVLRENAKPVTATDGGRDFIVVIRSGNPKTCTLHWFESLNGLRLMHSALGLDTGEPVATNLYWTQALLRAAEELCRS
jgi:hypothetical protein